MWSAAAGINLILLSLQLAGFNIHETEQAAHSHNNHNMDLWRLFLEQLATLLRPVFSFILHGMDIFTNARTSTKM